jgi:hypothetical protein
MQVNFGALPQNDADTGLGQGKQYYLANTQVASQSLDWQPQPACWSNEDLMIMIMIMRLAPMQQVSTISEFHILIGSGHEHPCLFWARKAQAQYLSYNQVLARFQ